MPNKKFKKQFLQDLVFGDIDESEAEILEDKLSGHNRWSVTHSIVFSFEGKYYTTSYSKGATECQEEHPFQYDEDEIDCFEVELVEVVKKEWRLVK